MDQANIQSDFFFDIVKGKYTLKGTVKKIEEYEAQYGKDFFADYDVKKKDKPWDIDYLNELESQGIAGMASKQFFIHVAEVSEYVHNNMKKKKHKKFLLMISAAVVAIIGVVVIIISKNS
ncbi:MAG: hypothetical protein IKO47_09215 [Ruminococcus sp.]|nr:hypothetical protein [Ruminococcus sp.]